MFAIFNIHTSYLEDPPFNQMRISLTKLSGIFTVKDRTRKEFYFCERIIDFYFEICLVFQCIIRLHHTRIWYPLLYSAGRQSCSWFGGRVTAPWRNESSSETSVWLEADTVKIKIETDVCLIVKHKPMCKQTCFQVCLTLVFWK